jgi:hypothetical protein
MEESLARLHRGQQTPCLQGRRGCVPRADADADADANSTSPIAQSRLALRWTQFPMILLFQSLQIRVLTTLPELPKPCRFCDSACRKLPRVDELPDRPREFSSSW